MVVITDTTAITAAAIMAFTVTMDIMATMGSTDTMGIMAAGMVIAATGMAVGGPMASDRAGAGRRTTIASFGSATDAL